MNRDTYFVLLLLLLFPSGLLSAVPGSRAPGAEPVLLFEAGSGTGAARLLAAQTARTRTEGGVQILDIPEGTDPYGRTEWLFRFDPGVLRGWSRMALEIEFLDQGAGVIQPSVLKDARWNGEWLDPAKKVSFTRLNTGRARRALFEFDPLLLDAPPEGKPNLKIAGLQGLKRMQACPSFSEEEWKRARDSVPVLVEPMVRLSRPMEIHATVGIPDIGNPPPLEVALDHIREYAPLARLLGFTSVECYVRWDLIEPQPGKFDFRHYDLLVDAIRRRGLRWFPNLVITSAYALPSWHFESRENQGMICLEHGEVNQVPSIWNPANRAHVSRVLREFAGHYAPMQVLEAVRLGPSGNFGEAQYPAGAGSALGYQGRRMHAHIGWWAGDDYAAADFRKYLAGRYATVEELNRAWESSFRAFADIRPALPETYRTRRGRLDMTGWYTDSMSLWCAFWAREARRALPETRIYQSSGGWGYREAGTDFTAQAEAMKEVGGGIRLTNETDSFEQNVYATRLAATAAHLFDIPLGSEPAGFHSARGTVARFFHALTSNLDNLFTRHGVLFTDSLSVRNWLRDYPLLDLRRRPLVEIAVYYPETMNQLEDSAFRYLYAWGFNARAAEVRRRTDVHYLDERLIRRGFLDRYKVLVFCWGNILEKDVLEAVDRWIRAGGTAVFPNYPKGYYESVEGDSSLFQAWQRGDTGKGSFRRFAGDMEPIALYGDYLESVLTGVRNLHPWTRAALRVEHPPRVFLSVLEDGHLALLNYNDSPAEVRLPGEFQDTLPPYTIRVKALKPAGPAPSGN